MWDTQQSKKGQDSDHFSPPPGSPPTLHLHPKAPPPQKEEQGTEVPGVSGRSWLQGLLEAGMGLPGLES